MNSKQKFNLHWSQVTELDKKLRKKWYCAVFSENYSNFIWLNYGVVYDYSTHEYVFESEDHYNHVLLQVV